MLPKLYPKSTRLARLSNLNVTYEGVMGGESSQTTAYSPQNYILLALSLGDLL